MKLENISLYENNIESVEGFHRINMPSVVLLGLSQNNLSKIRDLRKGNWPKLQTILLYENCLNECSFLSTLYTPVFRELTFELQMFHKEQLIKMSMLAKMQTKKIEFLWMKSFTRIKEKAAIYAIKKKYPATYYSL